MSAFLPLTRIVYRVASNGVWLSIVTTHNNLESAREIAMARGEIMREEAYDLPRSGVERVYIGSSADRHTRYIFDGVPKKEIWVHPCTGSVGFLEYDFSSEVSR